MVSSFERRGEWSGYTVRHGRAGWIVDFDSRVQGAVSGRRVLVTYGAPYGYPADIDLADEHNDTLTKGEAIAEWASGRRGRRARVARRTRGPMSDQPQRGAGQPTGEISSAR